MIYRLLIMIWGKLPLPDWLQWHIMSLWTPRFRVAVASILIDEEHQILLCEHTYRPQYPWGLPGGNIKSHEDPDQAIEREIREETGLSVRILRTLFVRKHPDRPQISIIYLCTSMGGDFHPNAEVRRIRFFTPDDLPEAIIPSERKMIADAVQILAEEDATWRPKTAG